MASPLELFIELCLYRPKGWLQRLRRGGGEEWGGGVTPVLIKMKIYNRPITDQICKDLDSSQAKTKSPGRGVIALVCAPSWICQCVF